MRRPIIASTIAGRSVSADRRDERRVPSRSTCTRSAIDRDLVEAVGDVDDRDALLRSRRRNDEQDARPPGGESAAVGSSRISTRASSDSARAISTICRSPTRERADRGVGVEVDVELLEDAAGAPLHGCASPRSRARFGSRPSEMFSATVSVAASWNSWKIMRTPRSRAWRGWTTLWTSPSSSIVPSSAW